MRLKFGSHNVPILLLSDSPEQLTGLGRVGRDLAGLLSTLPQFRVGYLGRGGEGRRKFPWAQYSFPETEQWGEERIGRAWHDFAGSEPGIVMSLWDASRMLWFSRPDLLTTRPELQRFLGNGRTFEKWGYFPLDAEGIRDGVLPAAQAATLGGYDRVITASSWGRALAQNSIQSAAPDWIPHGVWTDIFKPIPDAKALLGWDADDVWVGCCMTNQARKDWPVAMETIAALRGHYGNRLKAWCHVDILRRHWDIEALASEYGVGDIIKISFTATDAELALHYSACDSTFLPSAGEGFGLPIAEAMACGTACVTTDYAGGAELVSEACRVSPVAFRIDTMHNVRRAVLAGQAFANRIIEQVEAKRLEPEVRGADLAEAVSHLGWGLLKHTWTKWFLKGIGQ